MEDNTLDICIQGFGIKKIFNSKSKEELDENIEKVGLILPYFGNILENKKKIDSFFECSNPNNPECDCYFCEEAKQKDGRQKNNSI